MLAAQEGIVRQSTPAVSMSPDIDITDLFGPKATPSVVQTVAATVASVGDGKTTGRGVFGAVFALVCTLFALVARPCVDRIVRSIQWVMVRIVRLGPVPKHVAFIMDGNRRYARKKNLPKSAGHTEGYIALLRTMQWCLDLGVKTVTVYAFSIENFNRPKDEVEVIMKLANDKLRQFLNSGLQIRARKMGASLKFIGNLGLLPPDLQALIDEVESKVTANDLRLNVCFSYTATQEITHAVKKTLEQVKEGNLSAEAITPDVIQENLYLKAAPSLLVRTSGELRLSDFLLWQGFNSYFHISNALWPEFSFWEMIKSLFWYQLNWAEMERRKNRLSAE